MRFFKNASKTKYKKIKGRKKSHVPSWEGAPKKRVSIHREKSGGGVQKKIKLLISDANEINELVTYVFIANTLMRHLMSLNVRS